MFGSTAATNDLIAWCRALRHGLDAGLSPVRIFRQQAKSGPSKLRSVADRVADRMETGDSLEDAFKPEAQKFPPIFVEMVAVGEHAGRLPDVFRELEEYFDQVRLARKTFLTMLVWPVIQYVGAILVITILIAVLGLIGSGIDPIGLGLTGVTGAVIFFAAAVCFTASIVFAVLFVMNNREARAKVEAFALGIPGVGGCFRCFAVARFSMAAYMTMEAGLKADRCLGFSLRATANRAYTVHASAAAKAARKGEDIPSVLSGYGTRLFPEEFLNAVAIGEESGQLAEVMKRQAAHYNEEAKEKLRWLAQIAAGLIWACIGILLIVMIFKIFITAYLNPLNDAINATKNPDAFMRAK